MLKKEIKIGNVTIGRSNPYVLIAGPCVIESEASALRHAGALKKITSSLGVPLVFKSSYDKANRTSIDSFRGPGLKRGLRILKRIKDDLGLPILSDVHCKEDIKDAGRILDVIQILSLIHI